MALSIDRGPLLDWAYMILIFPIWKTYFYANGYTAVGASFDFNLTIFSIS